VLPILSIAAAMFRLVGYSLARRSTVSNVDHLEAIAVKVDEFV
jgi:hypothetical protein